jgi:hypothetical protein
MIENYGPLQADIHSVKNKMSVRAALREVTVGLWWCAISPFWCHAVDESDWSQCDTLGTGFRKSGIVSSRFWWTVWKWQFERKWLPFL